MKDGIDLLRRARLPDGSRAFTRRELRHTSDVRTLAGRLYTLQLVAGAAIVALALALRVWERRAQGGKALVANPAA